MKKKSLSILGIILIILFVISLLFFRNTYLPEILAFLIVIIISAFLLAKILGKTQKEKKPPFSLPDKTEIAVWLMTLIGIIGIFLSLLIFFLGGWFMLYLRETIPLVIILFPSFLVRGRQKWAWNFAILLLLFAIFLNEFFYRGGGGGASIFFYFGLPFSLFSITHIIILILLFLDRKNFWKIAT